MIIIPYLLTYLIGTLCLQLIVKKTPLPSILFITLSALTGISITIFITFFGFALFNQFNLTFITSTHILSITILLLFLKPRIFIDYHRPTITCILTSFTIIFSGLLSFIYAKIYPLGGWDAWTLWNFKSKFLLFSGTRWKELFDPTLLRFHPHYPVGLPLFNAWTWAFTEGTSVFAPLLNSVIFNMLMAGLMIGTLQRRSSSKLIYLPIIILFLSPAYMTFMTNQYCDILLSLYLLAALSTMVETYHSSKNHFFILSGIFIGTLSFLKLEGAALAALAFLGMHFYILRKTKKVKPALSFWLSVLLSALPMILFLLFLSPGKLSFTNGLTSTDNPSTFLRLKTILIGFFLEISALKWRFLWGSLFTVGLLYLKQIFRKDLLIFPFVILIYLLIVILQYWINTYYPIIWWMQNSLNRILTVLLPTCIIWLSLGIIKQKGSSD